MIWHKLIHFFILLNPAIQRMDNTPNNLHPRCMEQDEPHPHFTFYCKLFKVTLDYISELINLSYSFNLPFKFSLKTIKRAPSQFYDGVHLKILPTLLEVILMHLFKACHEDGYDKINELSNFKCGLLSFFNKLKDTANELGSKNFFREPKKLRT